MTVGGIFVGHPDPENTTPQTLLIACYGDKVVAKLKLRDEESRRRFFIGTTPVVPHQRKANRIAGFDRRPLRSLVRFPEES